MNNLCEELDQHIARKPDYSLKRMMLFGSLVKRTSLRTISDADVAVYVRPDRVPKDMVEFLEWLANELAFLDPSIERSDIEPKTYSVSINFRGKGINVDVVPIEWLNNKWDGDLISQDNGNRLRTNIPQHIEFIKTRHERHSDFRQIVRLLKFWANEQKRSCGFDETDEPKFRFKSFMIELIVAYLVDKKKMPLGDYPEALQAFYEYLVTTQLTETISFDDFGHGSVQKQDTPINIFDPVNSDNNIADRYTEQNKDLIMDRAEYALDAIDYASSAITKDIALCQWRKVFGSSFRV